MNTKAIMTKAWIAARKAAARFGGRASEYLRETLRNAWKAARAAVEKAMKSISVKIRPCDKKCRYWAKIIPANAALPLPSDAAEKGAHAIAQNYARHGLEELLEGEFLIEGEEVSSRRQRGWDYWVSWVHADGRKASFINPDAQVKAALKAAGMAPELLKGAGHLAACIRLAHAVRLGLFTPAEDNLFDAE